MKMMSGAFETEFQLTCEYEIDADYVNTETDSGQGSTSLNVCTKCSAKLSETGEGGESLMICKSCGALQSREETTFETTMSTSGCSFIPSKNFMLCGFKYRRFIAKTCATCNVLKLPEDIIEQITSLADKSFSDEYLKRMSIGARIAGCIYYVTRQAEISNVTLSKLSRATQVPAPYIYKYLKILMKRLELKPLPLISLVNHVESFSALFPKKHQQALIDSAFKIESAVKIGISGSFPVTSAAALLKVASEAKGISSSLKSLCKDISVSYKSIISITLDIKKSLLKIAEEIPWKPKDITYKNVTKFLPEILRYLEHFGDVDEEVPSYENAADDFQSKAMQVIKMREEGRNIDEASFKDPAIQIVHELLDRGCTDHEILNGSLVALSKRYIDYISENDFDDQEIPDEDIAALLKQDTLEQPLYHL